MPRSTNIDTVLNEAGVLTIGKNYTTPVNDNDAAPKKYVDDLTTVSRELITQTTHGFVLGDVIYFNGTIWVKAQSNDISTVGTKMVSEVVDDNEFRIADSGIVSGLLGLIAGSYYYVSDITPGEITTVTGSSIINPIGQARSTTELDVQFTRADFVTGEAENLTFRSAYDSINPSYLYKGTATRGTATSAASWRISRFDFDTGTITFSDGDQLYNNVWDNRESLSYS